MWQRLVTALAQGGMPARGTWHSGGFCLLCAFLALEGERCSFIVRLSSFQSSSGAKYEWL